MAGTTIDDLLTGIENSKEEIQATIAAKGVIIPEETKLDAFAPYIAAIPNTTYELTDVDSKINLVGSDGTTSSITTPLATTSVRGGIKLGYSASGANIPLKASSEKGYVTLTKTAITSAIGYDPSTAAVVIEADSLLNDYAQLVNVGSVYRSLSSSEITLFNNIRMLNQPCIVLSRGNLDGAEIEVFATKGSGVYTSETAFVTLQTQFAELQVRLYIDLVNNTLNGIRVNLDNISIVGHSHTISLTPTTTKVYSITNVGTLPSLTTTSKSVLTGVTFTAGTTPKAINLQGGCLNILDGTAPTLTPSSESVKVVSSWSAGSLPTKGTEVKAYTGLTAKTVD